MEQFFDTTYYKFIKKFRFLIVFTCCIITSFSAYKSTEVQGLSSMEQFFGDSHDLTLGFAKAQNGFNTGENGQSIIVDIMWGVIGINRTGTDRFNAS